MLLSTSRTFVACINFLTRCVVEARLNCKRETDNLAIIIQYLKVDAKPFDINEDFITALFT